MHHLKSNSYTIAKIIACVIFGFSYLFTDSALAVASPAVLLSCRFLLACGLLVVLRIPYWCRHRHKEKRPFWPMLLMGVFEPTLYLLLESYAIVHTSTVFSAVILSLTPILAVILAAVFLKEFPTIGQYGGMLLSVLGAILVSWENVERDVAKPVHILMLLAAILCSAIFVVLSRKYSAIYSAYERTLGMFTTAAIVFAVLALRETKGDMSVFVTALGNQDFLVSVLYLGGLSSVVAFFLVNYSNNKLPVVAACALGAISPVVSLFSGVFLLNESFGGRSLLGVVLILLGTVGVQILEKRKNEKG